MIKNGKGGGNTKTGLIFEGETDLATFLSKQPSYSVDDGVVYYEGKKVARIFKKDGRYIPQSYCRECRSAHCEAGKPCKVKIF